MSKFFGSKPPFYTIVVSVFITLLAFYHGPTAMGAQDQRPLLGTRVENVNATSNITLNLTLPSGFTLSGAVMSQDQMPIFFGSVIARSGNQTFTGPITFNYTSFSSIYRLVLPPGTYTLSVQRLDPNASLFITSDLPGMVTVMGNLTLNITVPAPPATVPVSGNITSLGTLPTRGNISFSSSDRKIQALANFDRSYRLNLPRGTYDVSVSLELMHPDGLRQFLTLRLGMINVSGPQTANFKLPMTVTLSGTVRNSTGTPAVPSSVSALDPNDVANLPGGVGCGGALSPVFVATFGGVSIPKESTTGAYRLTLPPRAYSVAVSIDLDQGDEVISSLTFPVPSQQLNLSTDQTLNFVVPPLPPFVTISGRVTDSSGQPVAEAIVFAFTSMIMNTPNATFSTSVQTGSDGSYQLSVLSGTNYTILVCPPQPASTNSQAASILNRLRQTFLRDR